ncbi:MAG: hypothetical protein AAB421_02635 [Patescibacteria group bacterium]
METIKDMGKWSAGAFFALILVFGLGTGTAHAQTAPACTTPVINNFTPHVYEGSLDSFDYTVEGQGSILVVGTEVSGRKIEPRYATTWREAKTRIHVDVPGWYGFSGNTSIKVQVMTGASTTCMTTQSFSVVLPVVAAVAKPVYTTSATPSVKAETPAPKPQPVVTLEKKMNGKDVAPTPVAQEETSNSEKKADTKKIDSAKKSEGFLKSFVSAFASKGVVGKCTSWSLPVWIILVIIAIVAGLIMLDSLAYLMTNGGVRFTVLLLAIFIALLGTWFFFDGCRSHQWFPIVLTCITLGVLIAPAALEPTEKKKK